MKTSIWCTLGKRRQARLSTWSSSGGSLKWNFKVLGIQRWDEPTERVQRVGDKNEVKCFKNGKNQVSFQSYGFTKCKTWLLFVFSADNRKKLVAAWAKHLSATERSSWVPSFFFIYYLNFICWYIPLVHFKTFKIEWICY